MLNVMKKKNKQKMEKEEEEEEKGDDKRRKKKMKEGYEKDEEEEEAEQEQEDTKIIQTKTRAKKNTPTKDLDITRHTIRPHLIPLAMSVVLCYWVWLCPGNLLQLLDLGVFVVEDQLQVFQLLAKVLHLGVG